MSASREDRFQIYRDAAGAWRWRLIAPNGRIVADSGEGYSSYAHAYRAAVRLRARTGTARLPARLVRRTARPGSTANAVPPLIHALVRGSARTRR